MTREIRRPAGTGLGDTSSIITLINQAAAKYGLNPSLLLAQAQAESSLNPNAVSSEGAQGIMQLMPATAASLGVTNAFDPVQNIDAGARYLSQLLNQYGGNMAMALAAYNAGPGTVAKFNGIPPQSQSYVDKILGAVGQSSSDFPSVPTHRPPVTEPKA